jgi:hypothetical protein
MPDAFIWIKILRSGQGLSLGNRHAEPLPWNHRVECREWIAPVITRSDQGCSDPGIEPDLFVDRPSIGLKISGVPAFRLAEHRPDQPIEQINGMIGEAGRQIEGNRREGGVAAPALVTGDMLHRHAACLTGNLREPCLIYQVAARRINPDRPHMLQPLDQAEH